MKKRKYSFRKFVGDVHLWLGVVSGIVLFIICLTGTIYVFKTEIEEYIEPEKFNIKVQKKKLLIEEMIEIIEQTTKGKVSRIIYTENSSRPYEFNVKMNKEDRRGSNFLINQYTGKVIGNVKGKASEFFFTVFKIHRWLLMDMEKGRPITGVATVIFILLCFSGLIIWIPKKIKNWKSFKPSLKIMWSAKWKRINHDLHSVLGFYSFIFLLIIGLTGLTWSYEWYNKGLYKLLTGKEMEQREGSKNKGDSKEQQKAIPIISYETAISLAEKQLTYSGKVIVQKVNFDGSPYEITKFNSRRMNKEAADKIFINATNGEVEKIEIFNDFSLGERIIKQIHGLHMGTTYGLFSKIIYFVACLIATTMPITGIVIWINKMKFGSENI